MLAMIGQWFSTSCGGPRVRLLENGRYEIEGADTPHLQINDAVKSFQPEIKKWSDYYGVPDQIVAGLVMRESRGNQWAVSSAGALGLMQLLDPSLRNGYSNDELKDNADLNIKIGTGHVAYLLKRFKGNIIEALTSYNRGHVECGGSNPWNLQNENDFVGGTIKYINGAVSSGYFGPNAAPSQIPPRPKKPGIKIPIHVVIPSVLPDIPLVKEEKPHWLASAIGAGIGLAIVWNYPTIARKVRSFR